MSENATRTANSASEAERDLIASMEAEGDVARQLSRHAELLPIASFGETGRFVLGRLRDFTPLALGMLAATIMAALAGALGPYFMGRAVDVVTAGGTTQALWTIAGMIVAAGAVQALASALSRALISGLGQRLLAGMREDVIDRALDLPTQTMEQAGIGDALSRVADDVDVTAKALSLIHI